MKILLLKKFLILFLLLAVFSSPGQTLVSSATAVAETQVETTGETQIYQSVETTVNGQTVKKESSQPGKLELKMEKTGEGEPTVTFSQESQEEILSSPSSQTITPSPAPGSVQKTEEGKLQTIFKPIIDFFRGVLDNFFEIFTKLK